MLHKHNPWNLEKIILKTLFWKFFSSYKFLKKKREIRLKNKKPSPKAKEIGGTYSTPPLATIILVAIKIGWINNNK